MAIIIGVTFIFGALIYLTESYGESLLVALIGIIALIYNHYAYKKKPTIYLNKSDFQAVLNNGLCYTGNYQDFMLYIDEPPNNNFGGKGYRYSISLQSQNNPALKFALYSSLFVPENVRDIIEKIQQSIDSPMLVAFASEKLNNDYDHAYDVEPRRTATWKFRMLFKKKTPIEKIKGQLEQQRNQAALKQMVRKQAEFKLAILCVAGVIIFFFSGMMIYKESYVYSKWTPVMAEILYVHPSSEITLKGRKDYYTYTLSYSYGQRTYTDDRRRDGMPKIFVGQHIPIKFDPNKPANNTDDLPHLDGLFFLMFISVLMTLIPLYFLFRNSKAKKNKTWRKPLLIIGVLILGSAFVYRSNDRIPAILFFIGMFIAIPCLALIIKDFIVSRFSGNSDISVGPVEQSTVTRRSEP